MSERDSPQQGLGAFLWPHGVAVRNLKEISTKFHSSYRQFSLDLDEKRLGDFVSLFKQISYSAVFPHAQQVSDQTNAKFEAWEWVKQHARMYLDAPKEPQFDRRSVIGGLANAFGRSLITMGRARYALHWPACLRFEFVSPWQEVSAPRMDLFGWGLEPSVGGSPSKRNLTKVKRVAEKMKACWILESEDVIPASPTEGPSGAAQEHGAFGNWSSSDENGANRSLAPRAPAASSPAQYFPATRIAEVMDRKEGASMTNPLEGWPHEDQCWPTTAGRCVHSDPIFTEGLVRPPAQVGRSDSDILTRAPTHVGAERVPAEEF